MQPAEAVIAVEPERHDADVAPPPVRVVGKFFFAGPNKFFVKGVTYGPFPVASHGSQFPERAVAERDFRLIAELGYP